MRWGRLNLVKSADRGVLLSIPLPQRFLDYWLWRTKETPEERKMREANHRNNPDLR